MQEHFQIQEALHHQSMQGRPEPGKINQEMVLTLALNKVILIIVQVQIH
jgi:hypothetical protein